MGITPQGSKSVTRNGDIVTIEWGDVAKQPTVLSQREYFDTFVKPIGIASNEQLAAEEEAREKSRQLKALEAAENHKLATAKLDMAKARIELLKARRDERR